MTEVQFTDKITVEVVQVLASDQMVCDAARVSTLGKGAAAVGRPVAPLINALMREHHGSPFEHNLFKFRVTAPLNCWPQHLKHRVGWSYNAESGRYSTFQPVFYLPPAERGLVQVGKAINYDIQQGSEEHRKDVLYMLEGQARSAYEVYRYLLDRGTAREVARMALPGNLMTTYYTTCNARSLMHFLALRTSNTGASHPQWEIEQIAAGYEEALAVHMPFTHGAFEEFGRIAP